MESTVLNANRLTQPSAAGICRTYHCCDRIPGCIQLQWLHHFTDMSKMTRQTRTSLGRTQQIWTFPQQLHRKLQFR
ncbi:Hypothetical predicted protein [Pelobates cultripes]|uniref:Uncharacterized protein n=1 Tax=Pelobates cultripes TaxID=61616 RepID=A0AAD1R9L6_PELCU|nr:Hypothetical predicted protein [Pelobates cultripes]